MGDIFLRGPMPVHNGTPCEGASCMDLRRPSCLCQQPRRKVRDAGWLLVRQGTDGERPSYRATGPKRSTKSAGAKSAGKSERGNQGVWFHVRRPATKSEDEIRVSGSPSSGSPSGVWFSVVAKSGCLVLRPDLILTRVSDSDQLLASGPEPPATSIAP